MQDEDANDRAARAARGSPFLTPQQAAHFLGLSVRTLQEYRSAGTGPRCDARCARIASVWSAAGTFEVAMRQA